LFVGILLSENRRIHFQYAPEFLAKEIDRSPFTLPQGVSATLEKVGIKDVVWHTLQHTCAPRDIMAGVDIRTV
jgi:hypothetical protein